MDYRLTQDWEIEPWSELPDKSTRCILGTLLSTDIAICCLSPRCHVAQYFCIERCAPFSPVSVIVTRTSVSSCPELLVKYTSSEMSQPSSREHCKPVTLREHPARAHSKTARRRVLMYLVAVVVFIVSFCCV